MGKTNLLVIGAERNEDVFDLKLTEWIDSNIGSGDYGVFEIDEGTLRKINENEIFIVDYRTHCQTKEVKFYKNRHKDTFLTMCKFCFQFFRTVITKII